MHCKKGYLRSSHGQEEKSKEAEVLLYHPLSLTAINFNHSKPLGGLQNSKASLTCPLY